MEVNELFLNAKQARLLASLGFDMSDAAFCWHRIGDGESYQISTNSAHVGGDSVPTYTLEELLGRLYNLIIQDQELYWSLVERFPNLKHEIDAYIINDIKTLPSILDRDLFNKAFEMAVKVLIRLNA